MNILAIDTSCDDTSAAVVQDGKILSNIISSQIQFHKEWGGVVPSLAKRLHGEKIDIVLQKALQFAHMSMKDIDAVAVTYGPGLAIALEVGVAKAKELGNTYQIPVIPINHMEGHLYSVFAKNKNGKGNIQICRFPYLALLVSGNHTELILMSDHGRYEKIGEALDDAAGEAFDKVSRMLGLGYPGGVIISNFAKNGDANRFPLPVPMEYSKDFNFSYSGLKTATMRVVNQLKEESLFDKQRIFDIAASFQNAAIEELCLKTIKALNTYTVNGLMLGGGVSANILLRKKLRIICNKQNIPLYLPINKRLCTDNAAMIGICAYFKIQTNGIAAIQNNSFDRDPVASL